MQGVLTMTNRQPSGVTDTAMNFSAPPWRPSKNSSLWSCVQAGGVVWAVHALNMR